MGEHFDFAVVGVADAGIVADIADTGDIHYMVADTAVTVVAVDNTVALVETADTPGGTAVAQSVTDVG